MRQVSPFSVAAVVTALITAGVTLDYQLAGDVSLTRGLQAIFTDPGWAQRVSQLPSAPAKYVVMVMTVARVVLGAHWPSDVILTTVLCLAWLWAAGRTWVPRAATR